MEGDETYQGEVLNHLEDLMETEQYEPEYEPEPAAPAHDAAAEHQQALAADLVQRHPLLADRDVGERLLTEARAQAERLGVPELGEDLRFIGKVVDELGASAFLSPGEQIALGGREGLGGRVLDFRMD
jgi:hypothetical protein